MIRQRAFAPWIKMAARIEQNMEGLTQTWRTFEKTTDLYDRTLLDKSFITVGFENCHVWKRLLMGLWRKTIVKTKQSEGSRTELDAENETILMCWMMITGIVLVLMVIIMVSVGLVMCWLVLVGFYPLDENQPLNPIGITPHYIMEYCNVFNGTKVHFWQVWFPLVSKYAVY